MAPAPSLCTNAYPPFLTIHFSSALNLIPQTSFASLLLLLHRNRNFARRCKPHWAMAQSSFSVQNIAALYSSVFAESLSNSERQAAARALLRHDAHLDGTHYHTRKPGGLHLSYAAFNSFATTKECSLTHEELVEASLQDLFDLVCFYFMFHTHPINYSCRSLCRTVLMEASLF